MADKKISALTSLAQGDVAASTDVLPIVDTSATETKKITASALVGAGMTAGVTNVDINSGSIDGTTIGANSAAAGTFTTLTGTTKVVSPYVDAVGSAGGQLRNASGTSLLAWGAGGGSNLSLEVATNINPANAAVSIAPTGTGTVTINPATAGTMNNVAIGGSTAAAGSFTTLTTSSTVTLNGGTANGVLYLNGSKVATSGSAFVFDGTNVGIGTSSPATLVDARDGVGSILTLGNTGTFTAGESSYLKFREANTALADIGWEANTNEVRINNRIAGPMTFYTSNSEKMHLDSSGNLGLGVTPSAWGAGSQALQNGGGSFFQYNNDRIFIGQNSYIDSSFNDKFIGNGYATRYRQYAGTHAFYVSTVSNSSGAGASQSLTQAMTLDASGNLIVGNTTANGKLDVYKGVAYNADAALYSSIGVNDGAVNNNKVYYWRTGLTGDANGQNYVFQTLARTESSWVDRARITSGGDFIVGGTSAPLSQANRGNITVNGSNDAIVNLTTGGTSRAWFFSTSTNAYLSAASGIPIIFEPGGSEKARISSTGSFTVNATTSIATGTNTLQDSGSSPQTLRLYNDTDSNNTTNRFLICDAAASALRAEIRSNGGLANYSANDVNLSDERTKKDIAPLGSMWDKIKAIEIVTFKYKDQTHDDDNIGAIAQQVESVAPEFVDADGWGETPEGEEPLKSIYTADMYHAAIKALQEAMTRIEQLEAKVAALESK
jgi:hypothetical protein